MSNNQSEKTDEKDSAEETCEECGNPPKGVTMGPGDEGWRCPYCGYYNEFETEAGR